MSCSKMIATKLRGVGDKFATGSRHPRRLCDYFARNLSHKFFEHVQNYRDYFAPLGDTCEDITNHWRLFRDCFASHSRCMSLAVAKQSQSSEIGALGPPVLRSRPAPLTKGRLGIAESEINILKFPSQKEKYVYVLSKRLVLFI